MFVLTCRQTDFYTGILQANRKLVPQANHLEKALNERGVNVGAALHR
jgi:hypothetical protein